MDAAEIGSVLRNKRVERDLSVEDIAGRLNITAQMVERIENGEHDKLHEGVFARGYIRYYARVLGLDPFELLEDQEKQVIDTPPDDDLVYGHNEALLRQVRIWGSVAVAAILALLVYAWWAESGNAPPYAEDPQGSGEMLIPEDSNAFGTSSDGDMDEGADAAAGSQEAPVEPGAVDEPVGEAVAPYQPTPYQPLPLATDEAKATDTGGSEPVPEVAGQDREPATEEAPPSPEPASVKLQTREYESWVQVVDADGVKLGETLLAPFSEVVVQGKAPFDFKIGYVDGVSLYIDGELYDFSQYEDRGLAFFRAP